MNDDVESLQGTWTISRLEMDGRTMPDSMVSGARVEVAGNRFTSIGMGAEYSGILELDPSKKPPQFDLKFDRGPEKGNVNRGIYQLEVDSWTICLNTTGGARPKAFKSPPGSGIAVEVLVRGATQPEAKTVDDASTLPPAGTASASELEGEWAMLSGVMDGNPMEESLLKWVKRVTHGNVTSVLAGPQVMLKAEFTHDPYATPKTIDYLNLAGSNKGKAQLGIYEMDGRILRIYMAAPGLPRPTAFDPSPGKGTTYTTWKRA